jgi:hypothetical protein
MVGGFALQGTTNFPLFVSLPKGLPIYFLILPDKMPFRKAFFAGILIVGGVLAGPGSYITIINATPYDFQLTYSHEYEWIGDQ